MPRGRPTRGSTSASAIPADRHPRRRRRAQRDRLLGDQLGRRPVRRQLDLAEQPLRPRARVPRSGAQAAPARDHIAANLVVGNSNRNAPAAALPATRLWQRGAHRRRRRQHGRAQHHRRPRAARRSWSRRCTTGTGGPPGTTSSATTASSAPAGPTSHSAARRASATASREPLCGAAPAGLELFQGCGGLRLPLGFDPLPMVSVVFYRGMTVERRTFPTGATSRCRPRSRPCRPPHRAGPAGGTGLRDAPLRPRPGAPAGGRRAGTHRGWGRRRELRISGPGGRLLGSATFWLAAGPALLWLTRGRRRPLPLGPRRDLPSTCCCSPRRP